MVTVSKIVILIGQVILTSSFVFRSIRKASGKPLYFFYAANQEVCLKSCYEEEESNCTYVVYESVHQKILCQLYSNGSQEIPSAQGSQVYQLYREQTDATCLNLEVAREIAFQKIIPKTVTVPNTHCPTPINATNVITFGAWYYNNFRFFYEESTRNPTSYTNSSYRLSFSKGPRSGCTSVPVFTKTVPRRFYFGNIYNTTGYKFAGAYAFAGHCDCVGTQEIQEYIDSNGNYYYGKQGLEYFYDKTEKVDLADSGIGQSFFVANVATK